MRAAGRSKEKNRVNPNTDAGFRNMQVCFFLTSGEKKVEMLVQKAEGRGQVEKVRVSQRRRHRRLSCG
jgi:hypothetical protein